MPPFSLRARKCLLPPPLVAVKFISHILGSNEQYHDQLSTWLSTVTPPESRWTRCYRAAEHGWSAESFHSRCDNRGPTVTLVKVHEFIFGGFLDQPWGGKKDCCQLPDKKKQLVLQLFSSFIKNRFGDDHKIHDGESTAWLMVRSSVSSCNYGLPSFSRY